MILHFSLLVEIGTSLLCSTILHMLSSAAIHTHKPRSSKKIALEMLTVIKIQFFNYLQQEA